MPPGWVKLREPKRSFLCGANRRWGMLFPSQRRKEIVMYDKNRCSRHRHRGVALFALGLLLALTTGAQAQEIDRAFVTSDGTGTVYANPTHVVFWLHRTVTSDSMETSITESAEMGPALRAWLSEHEVRPALVELRPPAVVSLEGNAVRTSAEIRFSMASFTGGDAGAARFGELCDQMKVLATAIACELTDPQLITTEKNAVIQEAVAEAAKNAYTAAAGAATALGATIHSVDLIEVGGIAWNDPPETEATFPTVEQLACTAAVRITYILEYP